MSTSAPHYSGHSCKGPPSTSITKIHTRCEWLFSKRTEADLDVSIDCVPLHLFDIIKHCSHHQSFHFPSMARWSCISSTDTDDGHVWLALQSFRRCGVLLSSLCSDNHCQIIPVRAHALCRNAIKIRSQWPGSWSFKLCFVFRKFLLALSENYSIQLDVFSCSSWSNKISDDHRLTNRPGWRLSDYQIRARVLVECGPS